MGSGASTAQEKIQAASDADVQSFFAELPEDNRKKIGLALEMLNAKPAWQECFVICGQYTCKDIPLMTKSSLKDAAIQVKEEPRAPRMSIMGVATNETAPADAKDNVFWIAEFECMDAWAGPDHKERETNKEYMKDVQAAGASAGEGMAGQIKDMAGSYTGAALHLEKPGPVSGEHDVFACLTKGKAKDEDSVEKIVELLKALGLKQLDAEDGALGYTVMRTKDMAGPLAKDDLVVYWVELFKTNEDFQKHKESQHVADATAKLKELTGEDPASYEFAQTKHFQK